MTRAKNLPIWNTIQELADHHMADEQRDYQACALEDRQHHIYPAWNELMQWVAEERELAHCGYDGWSNCETWVVALWLGDDEETDRFWQDAARECVRASADRATARVRLADKLREAVVRESLSSVSCLTTDLLSVALDEVDWLEIADHYVADISNEAVPSDHVTPNANRFTGLVLALDEAKFPLSQLVRTPGAEDAISPEELTTALNRHLAGDWGEMDSEDWDENELSLREGFRLMSVYRTESGVKFWIITEADRSVTTALLPDEY